MAIDEELLPHMRSVQNAERDMRELGLVWQTIESSAAISCPEEVATLLPTLVSTRSHFGELQHRLVEALAGEHREALGDELAARARCASDILVRNLFERTADVGFLATDEVLVAYCNAPPADRDALQDALRERLRAYRAKYTVYDDVMVLDASGQVLVRLQPSDPGVASQDPVVAEALARPGWIERFGPSDLAGQGAPVLLYAHRICGPDGRAQGVLVLHFRFHDELNRIFDSMADAQRQKALVLLDAHGSVIASSDELHIPLGAVLPALDADQIQLTSFAGRDYLAVRCASRGYQGYAGPRWQAQAMVSLLAAFRSRGDGNDAQEVPLDNPQLLGIQRDADGINRELRRVVWNGQLMAHQTREGERLRLKAVLQQVNLAGQRTRNRVSLAIQDLYRTAFGRTRAQASELARLAADIMDRNLYERANDCRWWALSPALAGILAEPASESGAQALNGLLDHLNSLYTVYSRILVFDADGQVRGASRAAPEEPFVGRSVPQAWREAVARLTDPQRYAVSDFEVCDFHDAGPTYAYLAAIPGGAGRAPVGGVALVFHARAEFGAMLRDLIGERRGFAAFVDGRGQVLESTDAGLAAAAAAAAMQNGTTILEHGGSTWACARSKAGGYREFKREDGYSNGVQALVGLRLGTPERRRTTLADHGLRVAALRVRARRSELAVFQVAGGRYALPVEAVAEAVPDDRLVRTPSRVPHVLGLLEATDEGGGRMVQVTCARALFSVSYPARRDDGMILVLRDPAGGAHPAVGLKVDDVLSVIEVDADRLQVAPLASSQTSTLVGHLVDCPIDSAPGEPSRSALVQVLDLDALMRVLLPHERRAARAGAHLQPA